MQYNEYDERWQADLSVEGLEDIAKHFDLEFRSSQMPSDDEFEYAVYDIKFGGRWHNANKMVESHIREHIAEHIDITGTSKQWRLPDNRWKSLVLAHIYRKEYVQ